MGDRAKNLSPFLLGAWIDLSVEGDRTAQAGGAGHQVALYGHLGWEPPPLRSTLLRRGEKSFAPPPRRVDRPERGGRSHRAGRRGRTPRRPVRSPGVGTASSEINPPAEGRPAGRPYTPGQPYGRRTLSPGSRSGQALPLSLSILRQRGRAKDFSPLRATVSLSPAFGPPFRRGDACVAPTTSGGSQIPKNGSLPSHRPFSVVHPFDPLTAPQAQEGDAGPRTSAPAPGGCGRDAQRPRLTHGDERPRRRFFLAISVQACLHVRDFRWRRNDDRLGSSRISSLLTFEAPSTEEPALSNGVFFHGKGTYKLPVHRRAPEIPIMRTSRT